MNDTTVGLITSALAILTLLSLTYGKFIGERQTQVVQAVIDGFQIESRFRPAINFLTGIALAVALSAFLAVWIGSWEVLVIGAVAGIFSSDEAAKVHDTLSNQTASVVSSEESNGTTTIIAAEIPVDNNN